MRASKLPFADGFTLVKAKYLFGNQRCKFKGKKEDNKRQFNYRTATARGKAEQSDIAAAHAREDSEIARVIAKQFAPDFHQPGSYTNQINYVQSKMRLSMQMSI